MNIATNLKIRRLGAVELFFFNVVPLLLILPH